MSYTLLSLTPRNGETYKITSKGRETKLIFMKKQNECLITTE